MFLILKQLYWSMCYMLSHFCHVWLFVTPWTARLLCPWGFSRQEYWSGLPCLLQGIFPTQGLNSSLWHCRQILYCLSHQGSPRILKWVAYKAETPVLWPPHAKSWLIGKDSDAGRDWGQEEKGMTEDEMAGWHHWLEGRESDWTPGVCDGQGGLACCDSWGCEELDTTEQLNWLKDAKIVYLASIMY